MGNIHDGNKGSLPKTERIFYKSPNVIELQTESIGTLTTEVRRQASRIAAPF